MDASHFPRQKGPAMTPTEKSIASLPLSAFFREGWLPLTWRDGKPILTINGVEHDAEELLKQERRP